MNRSSGKGAGDFFSSRDSPGEKWFRGRADSITIAGTAGMPEQLEIQE